VLPYGHLDARESDHKGALGDGGGRDQDGGDGGGRDQHAGRSLCRGVRWLGDVVEWSACRARRGGVSPVSPRERTVAIVIERSPLERPPT